MNADILCKYVKNQCTVEELRQLQAWLQEDASNEDYFRSFIESQEEVKPSEFEPHAQEAWREFKSHHLKDKSDDDFNRFRSHKRKDRSGSRKTKVAHQRVVSWALSAVAILLLAFMGIYFAKQAKLDANKEAKKLTYRVISTKRGQRTSLRLKDGTKIIINAASELRIPSDYAKDFRKIYLRGEAFFKVQHDSTSPFIVIAKNRYIKDLGTQFNVSTYDSTQLKVAVKRGVVAVGMMKGNQLRQEKGKLHKGSVGAISSDGKLSISSIKDMNLFFGWTEGKLIFRNTPFSEVVNRLNRKFNINGRIADPTLGSRTLTATYNKMPLNEILEVLSISLHITYDRHQGTIVFKNKKTI